MRHKEFPVGTMVRFAVEWAEPKQPLDATIALAPLGDRRQWRESLERAMVENGSIVMIVETPSSYRSPDKNKYVCLSGEKCVFIFHSLLFKLNPKAE